ncbi:MAG: hypothetical protein ACYDH9_16120 [Limisphaerales bacterium]
MKLLLVTSTALLSLSVLTVPTRANTIVFTELSSSSLTVTLNGSAYGTVTPNPDGNPERYQWAPPSGLSPSLGSPYLSYFPPGWADEGPTYNTIRDTSSNGGTSDGLHLYIDSDLQPDHQPWSPAGFQGNSDGTILSSYLMLTDAQNNTTTYDVQFIDLGDSPTSLPDSPQTMCLLLISGLALTGAARLRAFQVV